LIVAAAVLAAGITSRAFGQQNDPNARPDNRAASGPADAREGGDRGQENHLDRMVANQLLEMSKGEVALANFALQHTQNDQVKQFAQQMIEDHTNLNNQLAKFASPELAQGATGPGNQPGNAPGRTGPGTQPGNTPPRPGTTGPGSVGPGGAPAAAGQPTTGSEPGRGAAQPGQPPNPNATGRGSETASGDKGAELCEDIGKQMGSNITRELNQYQGSDFDRAYAGQQFWGHVAFIAFARGAERHVSPDLQQVVSQGASTAEKHLDHIRKLIRDLSASVARGNETTPRR